jgi:hypothetical protein
VRNYGQSARTYKSGLLFCVAEDDTSLKEEARKFLAWDAIYDEASELNFDEEQRKTIKQNMDRAKRDLTEQVWKSYKTLVFLDKNNALNKKDLGLIHSSQAQSLSQLYINRLVTEGEVTDEINPNYLVRNWPPAFKEWSIKNVRDAFYASPQFPRLLNPDSIKSSISKGVTNGFLAYIGKKGERYEPFIFNQPLGALDIEVSDDMFIVTAEEAKKHIEPRKLKTLKIIPPDVKIEPGKSYSFVAKGFDQHGDEINIEGVTWETSGGTITNKGLLTVPDTEGIYKITAKSEGIAANATVTVAAKVAGVEEPSLRTNGSGKKKISWSGQVNPQKWMIFYNKLLAKFSNNPNLKITVKFEIEDGVAITDQKIQETRTALKEMDLDDDI